MSRFADPRSEAATRWLLVANRAYDSTTTAQVTFTPSVHAVSQFDPASNTYRPVNAQTVSVTLPAGGAQLYRLR